MTAQVPQDQADDPKILVERFRAEQAAQPDKGLQALLLHECGVLEEGSGEEAHAARDYLAAFNLEPHFREPLEALVRILTRRKSIKNLGKLLDALTRAAVTPEESARAFGERAAYLQDYEKDLAGAKECLEEAISANPEDPLPWIELEMIAAKEGDEAGRNRALEARAELALDPTWKALFYVELAQLAADGGDSARAYELLDGAGALDGHGRFLTRRVLETIAAAEDNGDETARALEGQGELIIDAIADAEQGDATGVPGGMRTAAHAADAFLRAAGLRARAGDADAAATLLDRAAAALPTSPVLVRAKMVALEAAGHTMEAAELAKTQLEAGGTSAGAAALWLRIAESSVVSGDREAALTALGSALAADPSSIPARVKQLDLVAEGDDPAPLAASLEASAAAFSEGNAKGKRLLLAAYVWACKAGDQDKAKAALEAAKAAGTGDELVARMARSLAAITANGAWYEQATEALLALGTGDEEASSLWYELGRSRLLRGDEAAAAEAFTKLSEIGSAEGAPGPSAWLGRALGAYALGLRAEAEAGESPKPRSPEAIEQLARTETDPTMASALGLVAALRRARAGDLPGARAKLTELHEAAAGDEVIALFLAELSRRSGDMAAAAATLSACALATEDVELGAALHLEAAMMLWRSGDRPGAVAAMEAAQTGAPKAAATVLRWALCGADADSLGGRRRALDAAEEAGGDPSVVAIERVGLEVAGAGGEPGDPVEVTSALEALESGAFGDLAMAGALSRLVVPGAADERAALEAALDRLEEAGGEASKIARGEQLRIARTLDQDRALSVTRAEAWTEATNAAYAALEWLSAALGDEDHEAEVSARRALAASLADAPPLCDAIEASASAVASLDSMGLAQPFVPGDSPAVALMNLELSLPGCDPRRRAAALKALGDTLGDATAVDALAMAGWSELAAGAATTALETFRAVVEARPEDMGSWEGVRAAAQQLGDAIGEALACSQLGALSRDDARGAELWEQAGLILLEKTKATADAYISFERAFDRDPSRPVAFDKLFRYVRATPQHDKLLDIIARRLDVADDEQEIAKMFWERARVLRKKGDRDAALAALEDVTMLEPDHVGALALAGEIQITKGAFAKAAPLLGRLAMIDEAPAQQRLMSGIAAVDLYEKRLNEPAKALEVLVVLNQAGLATLQVRERLAASAARNEAWSEATSILEVLMHERDKPEGRIEAARLAMAIWRDKVGDLRKAEASVTKLLEEAPDDGEAIDLVLTAGYAAGPQSKLLGRAKATLLQRLAEDPTDVARVALLAKIAGSSQDAALRQATLGCLASLGRNDKAVSDELARLDGRSEARPQIRLDDAALAEISDPEDRGPVPELFFMLAETIALALGPSLVSLGVTKKDRVDSRGGHPLRLAVASWMGALGFEGDFDLYVGGRFPKGVTAVAGSDPALVLGAEITAPFDVATRSAVAREVFALRRGIAAVGTREDQTLASVVVAASIEAGLSLPQPPFAVYSEVARAIHKEIPRRVRKAIPDLCQRVQSTGQDVAAWAEAARRSMDRMSMLACGDASVVLSAALDVPPERLPDRVANSPRARRLLGFALSPSYLDLRRKLGMGVQ